MAALAIHSSAAPAATLPSTPEWVALGKNGKLRYQSDRAGNGMVDFSYAGYGGGGVRLPALAVRQEVSPSGADDCAAIQAALDAVAALPVTNGFRGAVLLKPGTFHCSLPLTLSQDGIVLRSSGSNKAGAVIEMTGAAHVCVAIAGERLRYPKEDRKSVFPISDARVPSGSLSLSV